MHLVVVGRHWEQLSWPAEEPALSWSCSARGHGCSQSAWASVLSTSFGRQLLVAFKVDLWGCFYDTVLLFIFKRDVHKLMISGRHVLK